MSQQLKQHAHDEGVIIDHDELTTEHRSECEVVVETTRQAWIASEPAF